MSSSYEFLEEYCNSLVQHVLHLNSIDCSNLYSSCFFRIFPQNGKERPVIIGVTNRVIATIRQLTGGKKSICSYNIWLLQVVEIQLKCSFTKTMKLEAPEKGTMVFKMLSAGSDKFWPLWTHKISCLIPCQTKAEDARTTWSGNFEYNWDMVNIFTFIRMLETDSKENRTITGVYKRPSAVSGQSTVSCTKGHKVEASPSLVEHAKKELPPILEYSSHFAARMSHTSPIATARKRSENRPKAEKYIEETFPTRKTLAEMNERDITGAHRMEEQNGNNSASKVYPSDNVHMKREEFRPKSRSPSHHDETVKQPNLDDKNVSSRKSLEIGVKWLEEGEEKEEGKVLHLVAAKENLGDKESEDATKDSKKKELENVHLPYSKRLANEKICDVEKQHSTQRIQETSGSGSKRAASEDILTYLPQKAHPQDSRQKDDEEEMVAKITMKTNEDKDTKMSIEQSELITSKDGFLDLKIPFKHLTVKTSDDRISFYGELKRKEEGKDLVARKPLDKEAASSETNLLSVLSKKGTSKEELNMKDSAEIRRETVPPYTLSKTEAGQAHRQQKDIGIISKELEDDILKSDLQSSTSVTTPENFQYFTQSSKDNTGTITKESPLHTRPKNEGKTVNDGVKEEKSKVLSQKCSPASVEQEGKVKCETDVGKKDTGSGTQTEDFLPYDKVREGKKSEVILKYVEEEAVGRNGSPISSTPLVKTFRLKRVTTNHRPTQTSEKDFVQYDAASDKEKVTEACIKAAKCRTVKSSKSDSVALPSKVRRVDGKQENVETKLSEKEPPHYNAATLCEDTAKPTVNDANSVALKEQHANVKCKSAVTQTPSEDTPQSEVLVKTRKAPRHSSKEDPEILETKTAESASFESQRAKEDTSIMAERLEKESPLYGTIMKPEQKKARSKTFKDDTVKPNTNDMGLILPKESLVKGSSVDFRKKTVRNESALVDLSVEKEKQKIHAKVKENDTMEPGISDISLASSQIRRSEIMKKDLLSPTSESKNVSHDTLHKKEKAVPVKQIKDGTKITMAKGTDFKSNASSTQRVKSDNRNQTSVKNIIGANINVEDEGEALNDQAQEFTPLQYKLSKPTLKRSAISEEIFSHNYPRRSRTEEDDKTETGYTLLNTEDEISKVNEKDLHLPLSKSKLKTREEAYLDSIEALRRRSVLFSKAEKDDEKKLDFIRKRSGTDTVKGYEKDSVPSKKPLSTPQQVDNVEAVLEERHLIHAVPKGKEKHDEENVFNDIDDEIFELRKLLPSEDTVLTEMERDVESIGPMKTRSPQHAKPKEDTHRLDGVLVDKVKKHGREDSLTKFPSRETSDKHCNEKGEVEANASTQMEDTEKKKAIQTLVSEKLRTESVTRTNHTKALSELPEEPLAPPVSPPYVSSEGDTEIKNDSNESLVSDHVPLYRDLLEWECGLIRSDVNMRKKRQIFSDQNVQDDDRYGLKAFSRSVWEQSLRAKSKERRRAFETTTTPNLDFFIKKSSTAYSISPDHILAPIHEELDAKEKDEEPPKADEKPAPPPPKTTPSSVNTFLSTVTSSDLYYSRDFLQELGVLRAVEKKYKLL